MDELAFPAAATLGIFFVVIPALTLAARAVLATLRKSTSVWAHFGSEATFAWLVAPVLLPLGWSISSALHQTEPDQWLAPCQISHGTATTCVDTVLLLAFLVVGVTAAVAYRLRLEQPGLRPRKLDGDHPLVRRVRALASADPNLRSLDVHVVRESPEPAFTGGLFRRHVVLDACFVHGADDEVVRAALLHEHAHVLGFDTLRGFVARVCMLVNPAGSLLADDFERWRNAREAVCDSEAVHRGGQPLALAESILRAVRFRCGGGTACGSAALCGHDQSALRLRLALLLEGPAAPLRSRGHLLLGLGLIVLIAIPHVPGMGALESFHFQVERVLGLVH